jgi:hypothetical protein
MHIKQLTDEQSDTINQIAIQTIEMIAQKYDLETKWAKCHDIIDLANCRCFFMFLEHHRPMHYATQEQALLQAIANLQDKSVLKCETSQEEDEFQELLQFQACIANNKIKYTMEVSNG